MILTIEQAKAVYDAMCALNNVGAILHTRYFVRENGIIHVKEFMTGEINVWIGDAISSPIGVKHIERYSTQDNFRKAYEL